MSAPDPAGFDRSRAIAFEDPDVARCYHHRPPYAPEAYDWLAELAPAHGRALDLGCGTGKIAVPLAERFSQVDAVDPSLAMIEVARECSSCVRFIVGRAETAPLDGPYDLVTAGASIHWMDHAALFPRLVSCLSPGGVVAFLDGDAAFEPPWQAAWRELVNRWLVRVGSAPDPAFETKMNAFLAWVDVRGQREFVFRHAQTPQDFVAKEHSRATWSRARLGAMAEEMDREMHAVIAPYVCDQVVSFDVRTRLIWGVPRASRHPASRHPA